MKKIITCIIATVLLMACNNVKKENPIVGADKKMESDKSAYYQSPATADAKTDEVKGLTSSANAGSVQLNSNTTMYAANATSTDAADQINDQSDANKPAPKQEKIKPEEPKKLPSKSYEDWDKKIIKTGNIVLELNNYKAYNNQIHNSVKKFGAYIAQEEQAQGDDKYENSIVIKVPVENFDDLINSIGGDSIKVIEKKISSQDVTSEVVDTKARIEAKKIVRQQYLELMHQAKNMKDILEVQTEINAIQEEIESAAGRVNYLVHQSAYSTVNLRYYQLLNGKKIEPDDSSSFLFKIREAFKTGGSIIGNILLLILSIWPIVIVGLVSLYLWKKKKQDKVNQS